MAKKRQIQRVFVLTSHSGCWPHTPRQMAGTGSPEQVFPEFSAAYQSLLLDAAWHRATARCTMERPLIAVLNGPNLNMLGQRQPEIYGSATLDDVEQICIQAADKLDLAIDFRQTNIEGELISWVQDCRKRARGIIINPAGYSHTSVALLDALLATDLPVIEVHISNIHRREPFRHMSYVSRAAVGVICGLGVTGYSLALQAMTDLILHEDDQ
ncbi:3-dehydroquinate dehydratase II [Acetobacter senegalensis]|uniref:3-dehydroquinate dehydratase n=4 Tax=Acetobacter TaxID=434 RepID=A0A0U4Y127_9PROT|nr:3-dehydroquinate dehydratase II [Acetobacter senegalensis]